MSLRVRIALVVMVAALLPVAILGYLLRTSMLERAQGEYRDRLLRTKEATERRVAQGRLRERRAIERLCEEDILVDRLLLDLEAGRFGPSEHADLVARVPGVMRSMGLMTLMILDARPGKSYGHVLASGHFPGHAGAYERDLTRAVERAGERWFVQRVRTRDGGETVELQAMLTGCEKARGGVRVIAVGGRVLDPAFVEGLSETPFVRLVLTGADGRLPPGVHAGGGRSDVWTFEGLSGKPRLRLVASVDDRPLKERLAALDRRLLLIGGVSAAGALLLALLLAVTITRPLAELEKAAARVASGDMTSALAVRGGGEVGRVLEAFNRMTTELVQAQRRLLRAERVAAWRDIAQRIAHEIKNPLMPIQTSIETLRKAQQRRHPDFAEIFEESTLTILEEVGRLSRIVTEFSRFARLPRPRLDTLDVQEVVQHVAQLYSTEAVELRVHADENGYSVIADREQITQVLMNLVVNAMAAANQAHPQGGGRVALRLGQDEAHVRIEVEDNGPGIPLDERRRIFEPYYTTKLNGTGLGLAIVHRIVGDHGGRIDVVDTDAGGICFRVELRREGPPAAARESDAPGSA